MVRIGTSGTDITQGDYGTDSTGGGLAYGRVLGKVTQNTSNRTARVDFKGQVSYEYQGYTAYNGNSHSYSITCTDNNGGGHSATSTGAFNEFGYNGEDRGVGGDNGWGNIPYRSNGTASFNATFSGARGNNSAFSGTTNIELEPLASYTVSFNANGGSGAPDPITKQQGVAITIPAGPIWSGHTFSGGNTAQNGTGTMYQPNATYMPNTNVTLYAQGGLETYTITYNANNGTGAPTPSTKIHGQTTYLSSVTPTREGYTFFRGNTAANGTGQDFSPVGAFNINANTTLYAIGMQNVTPPDVIHDCYLNIYDNGIPSFAYINVNGTGYFIQRTGLNVNSSGKDVSNKL